MVMREYFAGKLHGRGIDIGPLHRPMVTHAGMEKVLYVDRLPVSELRKQYPELAAEELVEADVLDDAETLSKFIDGTADFVIAAHVIEHMRNPLGALKNWWRVLKPGGLLYLVVPDHRKIFDKLRSTTPIEHMVNDYKVNGTDNFDLVHFYDFAENVNKQFYGRDIDVEEEVKKLVEMNYSIHFHCFTPESFTQLLDVFSRDIKPLLVLAGPIADPSDEHEFHVLTRKNVVV